MMLSEFEDRYVDSVLYMLQELADREELQRQQEEYRLQQEQLERQRLEQERIAQELEDKRRVCCRVSCRVLSLSDCRYSLNPLSQTRID